MKTNKILWLLLAGCLTLVACDDDKDDNSGSGTTPAGWTNDNANPQTRVEYGRLEMPRISNDDEHLVLIHKTADYKFDAYGVNYSVEWDCTKKAPRWIAYQMHKGYGGTAGRVSDIFLEDPDLPTSARFPDTNYQYSGSGFDRGHMCASADRQYSLTANLQTFYYTNMTPQIQDNFNGGIWADLEDKVRSWARSSDTLYVVTGCMVDKTLGYVRDNNGRHVSVPSAYFKAVLRYSKTSTIGFGNYAACGVYLEHKEYPGGNLPSGSVMSIDALEKKTGLDFFAFLPALVGESAASQIESQDPETVSWWGF